MTTDELTIGRQGRRSQRYTAVAMALHWLIALGIAALIAIGLAMTHAKLALPTLFSLYQLHKSLGISVLLLVVLRILWRLSHPPPSLPAAMPVPEKAAAHGAHVALYALMIGMPLTGWALVSASPLNIPTVLFGLVPWPHLPVFSTMSGKAAAEAVLKSVHAYGGWVLLGLAVLHAAAALRHHLVLRDTVLMRMLPGRRDLFQERQGS